MEPPQRGDAVGDARGLVHQRILLAEMTPVTDMEPLLNAVCAVRYTVVGAATLTRRLPCGADPQLGRRRGAGNTRGDRADGTRGRAH